MCFRDWGAWWLNRREDEVGRRDWHYSFLILIKLVLEELSFQQSRIWEKNEVQWGTVWGRCWTVLPEKRQREWWGTTSEASPLKMCGVAVRVPIKVVACSAVFTYEWLTFLCSQLIPALPLFCLAYPIHVTLPFSDSPVLQRLRWASQREALAENRGGWSLEPGLPTSDCLLRATVAASYLRVLPQESWSRHLNLAAELLKFLASSNGVEGRHS